MTADWIVQVEPEPTPELREQILEPLRKYNEAVAGSGNGRPFAISVRDTAGAVVGGLYGRTGYSFLYIELLTLGEARGHGLGRQVMELAEAQARDAGMSGIWLNTSTFQAPDFYPRFGFVEFGRIIDCPPGHDRIFYVKRLL